MKPILLIISVLFLSALVRGQADFSAMADNSWLQVPPTGECPNKGGDIHTACDTSGYMYLFGGCTYGNGAGGSHNNDIYRFDVRTGETARMANCANNVWSWKGGCQAGHTYDAKRNCVWFSGGAAATCAAGRNGLWKFQCPDGPAEYAADFGSTYILYDNINEKIYAMHGSSLSIFNCQTGTVEGSSNYPFGSINTWDLPVCFDSKRGLLVVTLCGPYSSQDVSKHVLDVYFYNGATGQWHSQTPPNYPPFMQAELEYDPVNDYYVYFGGSCESIVWVYDYDANLWTEMPKNGRSYNDAAPATSTWPPARHKHAWSYSPKYHIFINYMGGQWAPNACTDYDNVAKQPFWIYRPLPKDTGTIDHIQLQIGQTTIEQYQSSPLTVIAHYQGGATATVTDLCGFRSLDNLVAAVSTDGQVTGMEAGATRIAAIYWGNTDTVDVTITETTLSIDSVRITPSALGLMPGESYPLAVSGFYHNGANVFERDLAALATWTSDDTAVVSVASGLVTGESAGGPAAVVAEKDGVTDTCRVTVRPSLAFVRRINFQCNTTPFSQGWLADAGGAYDAGRGYGWESGAGGSRCDRAGDNFLLKSFVNPSTETGYVIAAPDGEYIIRVAMGDNTYGSATNPIWTVFGTDTIVKHLGRSNTIVDDTITVTGGQGIRLGVYGPINYIVVISSEGVDIGLVADDGGEVVPPARAKARPAAQSVSGISVHPNPFNPALKIAVSGQRLADSNIEIAIYDMKGSMIQRLSATSYQLSAGITWNAKGMPSGLYVVRVRAGKRTYLKRALLLK